MENLVFNLFYLFLGSHFCEKDLCSKGHVPPCVITFSLTKHDRFGMTKHDWFGRTKQCYPHDIKVLLHYC